MSHDGVRCGALRAFSRPPTPLGCWPAARSGEPCKAWLHENPADGGGVMSPLEVRNPGLHDFIAPNVPIERIAGGLGFTEGPVWRGTSLLFSDIPNKRIVRWRRLPEGPELTTY